MEDNSGNRYYRLKQISSRGTVTYSKMIRMSKLQTNQKIITHNTIVTNSINFQVYGIANDQYTIDYYTTAGSRIKQDRLQIYPGINATSVSFPSELALV